MRTPPALDDGVDARILFCGMESPGSALALRLMLEEGANVVAVVSALQPLGLPVLAPWADEPDLHTLARRADLPIIEVRSLRGEAAASQIAALRPDALVSCCFPLRVPPAILGIPQLGCLNIHPSLLPAWRGVEPLFWPFRMGETDTGVTLHLMDQEFDTGPILAQEQVAIPEGIDLLTLERELIELGAALLPSVIARLASGQVDTVAQQSGPATTAPLPLPGDLVLTTDRSATWAFRFVRGVAGVYGPLTLQLPDTDEVYSIRDALSFEPEASPHDLVERNGSELLVRFAPGAVRFLLAEP